MICVSPSTPSRERQMQWKYSARCPSRQACRKRQHGCHEAFATKTPSPGSKERTETQMPAVTGVRVQSISIPLSPRVCDGDVDDLILVCHAMCGGDERGEDDFTGR